ncbi:MAG: phenylacetate--CoA ligase [Abditibacteriota bacterium]|nr:phenylacetate--CoA ligase [Abditibacteriota bacterium]
MKDYYFNVKAETMSRDEIIYNQEKSLRRVVINAYANNDFYKAKFDKLGVNVRDIKGLEDLPKLGFIDKEDFREQFPMGMLCVPKEDLREIHMSSGSTGTPVAMVYNEHDLNQWAECMARCYTMAGLFEGDPVQITPTFGMFNGGLGMFHGARKAGLFIVPASSGNTPRQIRLMRDFNVKCLTGVVSYTVRIMEVMDEMGIELPNLKVGIFGAESFSTLMRERIEKRLGIDAFDIYGMTETGGVGTTGMDCRDHSGIHIWEDQYIVEIINPETGEVVPDGEYGEVVFTSLHRESIPIIRFKTGDLSRVISREPCACGRTHTKIEQIRGRKDDMIIVKGVNFFPKQVETALLEIPGVLNEYQIIVFEKDGVRDVRINVEAEDGVTGYIVEKKLKETLGFSPKGDVFKPGTLPRREGKAQRVIYEK